MAISTKNELVTYVLSLMNRETDQDIINNMDNFISVIEEDLLIKLRLPSNEYLIPYVTNEAGKFNLPSNYLETKSITVKTNNTQVVLDRYSFEQGLPLRDSSNYTHPVGFYRWGNIIQLVPAMSAEVEIIYWGLIYSLNNDANGSNFVLQMTPSIYVNGLMRELCAYTKDFDKANYWDGKFKSSLNNLQAVEDRDAFSGSTPFVTRVE